MERLDRIVPHTRMKREEDKDDEKRGVTGSMNGQQRTSTNGIKYAFISTNTMAYNYWK